MSILSVVNAIIALHYDVQQFRSKKAALVATKLWGLLPLGCVWCRSILLTQHFTTKECALLGFQMILLSYNHMGFIQCVGSIELSESATFLHCRHNHFWTTLFSPSVPSHFVLSVKSKGTWDTWVSLKLELMSAAKHLFLKPSSFHNKRRWDAASLCVIPLLLLCTEFLYRTWVPGTLRTVHKLYQSPNNESTIRYKINVKTPLSMGYEILTIYWKDRLFGCLSVSFR